jgi:hypothetical protein
MSVHILVYFSGCTQSGKYAHYIRTNAVIYCQGVYKYYRSDFQNRQMTVYWIRVLLKSNTNFQMLILLMRELDATELVFFF